MICGKKLEAITTQKGLFYSPSLPLAGVSPTYNLSTGTGTDGRCGVKTRNTYTPLVRKIEAFLFHQDISITIFPFSKKNPVAAVTL